MPSRPAPVTWLTAVDGRTVGYQIDPELVADFMLRAGVTKAELARRMRTSQGYVTDILTGRRQPREDKVRAMADALDVHPRALLLRALTANSTSQAARAESEIAS
jgi:transcriptional regulator with XRE-family HTH domain